MRSQIASAINVVIQVQRGDDGHRRVVSVQEISGMEGDIVTMSEIFTFRRFGMDADGTIRGRIEATGVIPAFHQRVGVRGIDLPVSVFAMPDTKH